MSKANRLLLQALAILLFMSSTSAALTLEQLEDSFYIEMNSDYGGSCNRDYEEVAMLPGALAAFEDAWLLSSTGVEMPPAQIRARNGDYASVQTFTRLRAMLFIYFGIFLNSNGQFDADMHRAYNNMLSEYQGADALQTESFDPFGYGLPKFRCLQDYSKFYEHMADQDGVEDPNLELAAVHFNQRYPGSNGGFLPGLMYDPVYNWYYRGTPSDPTKGYCDLDGTLAWTNSITGPPSPFYGITVCGVFFELPRLADLLSYDGPPTETPQAFIRTSGAILLSQMLMLQSRRGAPQALLLLLTNSAVCADQNLNIELTVQPRLHPRDGNWLSTDWSQWEFPDPLDGLAVSFEDCVRLGLAKPSYARKNAANYVHFALCLSLPELDCTSYLPAGVLA